MSLIQYFSPQPPLSECPAGLRNPLTNDPHPLALYAAKLLQDRLDNTPALTKALNEKTGGKMFGVLVVSDYAGRMGYLAGFSGMLNRSWNEKGFVPPVFNVEQQASFLKHGELEIEKLTNQINRLKDNPARRAAIRSLSGLKMQKEKELEVLKLRNRANKKIRRIQRVEIHEQKNQQRYLNELSFQSQSDKREYKQCKKEWERKLGAAQERFRIEFEIELDDLQKKRKRLSQRLHQQVFDGYRLNNAEGEAVNIRALFNGHVPPGGAGDCAAPKLIQYANQHELKPLALAEFWWGALPLQEVRHHGHFYPPCRGKCHPVLPFMLKGVDVEESPHLFTHSSQVPSIVYEDQYLVVLNKPAGLLSVPGKEQACSVQSWLQKRYPGTGIMLVHRLDMATSGLLLAAKSARVHKKLQKQFIERSVKKRYVAVLSKVLEQKEMTINLPLRVDLDDRPRQLVCHEYGKAAITRVKVLCSDEKNKTSRVYFYPLSGRTHQLRVHAAHPAGLSAPIVGDELYGTRSKRLLLHAEFLSFEHPVSGKRVDVEEMAPF